MKKILFIAVFMLLSTLVLAQTTKKWSVEDTGNGTEVAWVFTSLDSATAGVSPPFKLATGAYDFTQQGVVFLKKMVSTYGVPIHDVFLQFVGTAPDDSATLDSLAYQSVTESDSLGVSVFSYTTSAKNLQAGHWQIYIRNLNADINSGRITVFFPRRDI